jgi:hypothetical protein
MSFLEEMDARIIDTLSLSVIERALNAPTLTDVHNLQAYSGSEILWRAENFGAVAAIAVGRASQSALKVRERELLDLAFASAGRS